MKTSDVIAEYEQLRARLERQVEMIRASALKVEGQLATGTITAIEITQRRIAELDGAIAQSRAELRVKSNGGLGQ
jgi:hypothetical protein